MIIDLLFNFLHLFIVIIFFIYGVQKYLITQIKVDINNYNNYLNQLKLDKKITLESQKKLDLNIEQDNANYLDIKSKIALWVRANQRIRENYIVDSKNIKKLLLVRLNEQSENYQKSLLIRRITPELVDDIEKKLTKQYQNDSNKYISSILDNIVKE